MIDRPTTLPASRPFRDRASFRSIAAAVVLAAAGTILGRPGLAQVTSSSAGGSHAPSHPPVLRCLPTITTPSELPRATECVDYLAALSATGGTAPYVFTLSGGSLPPGVSLSANGVISGLPADSSSAVFTVTVTEAQGCFSTASFV